jgi:hypothetical protein
MTKRLLTFAGVALLAASPLQAQHVHKPGKPAHAHESAEQAPAHRSCGSMEHLNMLMANDPSLASRMQQEEIRTQNFIQNQYNPNQRVVYTIPVVFHVVYQNTTENISTAALNAQLQVLNDDFRKLNADASNVPSVWQSIAADCEINFCLATIDPQGNPTTGITRTQTTVGSFNTNDNVKFNSSGGKDAWPAGSYLNIWVCDLGSSLLGYAQFPGGPANTDGVVLNYRYTGTTATGAQPPFDKGRTATHEVGHYLNLYHIWGDDGGSCSGSDQVSDTPNQADATGGCYNPGTVLTDNCATSAPGYMWQNYMDYTDDACMYMFTNGQKARIQACMSGPRASLQNSQACGSSQTFANDAGMVSVVSPTGNICASSFQPVVTLRNFGTATLTSVTIQYRVDNAPFTNFSWTGSLASGNQVNVTLPTVTTTTGSHTFTTATSSPNGNTDGNTSNDQASSTFNVQGAGQNLPYTQGFESTTFPPAGHSVINADASTTWVRSTAASKTGVASMFIDNNNYAGTGELDIFVIPAVNLSSVNNPVLTFEVAYQLYTDPASNPNYSDTLRVQISTDCGQTWTTIYNKFGTALTTATPNFSSNAFVPTASQWRLETVALVPYASAQNAQFRFININDYENNLYIDDINITNTTGISSADLGGMFTLFPNPTNGLVTLNISLPQQERLQITITNALGQVVEHTEAGNTYGGQFNFDLATQPEGMYFVQIRAGEAVSTKRLIIAH